MTKNEALSKLQQVVAKEPSKWLENAEYRAENRDWMKKSQAVALKILRSLREQGLTQKDLAERMGVSPQQVNKWVKGKENFTFETISKLETALTIGLVNVSMVERNITFFEQTLTVIYPKVTRKEQKTIFVEAGTTVVNVGIYQNPFCECEKAIA